jgi:hypothetical protein
VLRVVLPAQPRRELLDVSACPERLEFWPDVALTSRSAALAFLIGFSSPEAGLSSRKSRVAARPEPLLHDAPRVVYHICVPGRLVQRHTPRIRPVPHPLVFIFAPREAAPCPTTAAAASCVPPAEVKAAVRT